MVHDDDARAALPREIGPEPLDEDAHALARLRQVEDVNEGPNQEGEDAGEVHLAGLHDRVALADDGHVALVEVAKGRLRRLAPHAAIDGAGRVPTLLQGYLGNA